ncbi:MAG: 2'-5' RNA ligase family protein [Chitinophagaceae bacterium]
MTTTIKKTSSFHWNSYGMMEYMLVLHPSETINEKLLVEKQEFYRQYGEKIAIKNKPYITVANFLAKEAMEDTLSRWLQNICNMQPSFELTLNNYSGFPPHTIYVRIQDAAPLHSLTHQLKILDDFIRSSDCPPLQTKSKPHITIARQLSMEVFDKALKEYSQKDFHESFMVKEMVLLKRQHQFDDCTIVNKFHFSQSGKS